MPSNLDALLRYHTQFRETIVPKIPLEMEFEIFNKILARTVKKA